MVANWMMPSTMSNVLGACNPPPLVQRNFDLIAARFGVAIPNVVDGSDVDLDADDAEAACETNFNAIATALGINLFPLQNAADPEVCCQANFELINALW